MEIDDDIIKILQEHNKEKNGDKDWFSPLEDQTDVLDYLRYNGKEVSTQDRSPHRWWDEFTVVKSFVIDDEEFLIGYRDARSTRDMSAEESGWMFDTSTVKQYKSEIIEKKIYKPIENE